MRFSSIIPFIIFLLLHQNANSYSVQLCRHDYLARCYEQIFDESNFSYEAINDLYLQDRNYKQLYINQTDANKDLIINVDDIKSEIDIYFQVPASSSVIIQTIGKRPPRVVSPSIYGENVNFIIENLDDSFNFTFFACSGFTWKTVKPKNTSKPLYLLIEAMHHFDFDIYFPSSIINSSIIYLNVSDFRICLDDFIDEPFTIVLSQSYPESYVYSQIDNIPDKAIITYGKNKVTIEYENHKTFTIILTTPYNYLIFNLGKETVVTVEENINSNDLIPPNLNSQSNSENDAVFPLIKGNWPIVENYLIGPGRYYQKFKKRFRVYSVFHFSAKNFPLADFEHLILTENCSSINFINYKYDRNITINTKEDIDTVFYINGRASKTMKDHEYLIYSYIISDSPKLTIILNAMDEIGHIGQNKIFYKQIDNSFNTFESSLGFQQGGTINVIIIKKCRIQMLLGHLF